MKRMSKLLTLVLALCMLLSVSAFASAEPASAEPAGGVAPGTYTGEIVVTPLANDTASDEYPPIPAGLAPGEEPPGGFGGID